MIIHLQKIVLKIAEVNVEKFVNEKMSGNPNIFKTRRCQFLVENLNLQRASGVGDAVWEHFQIDHLNSTSLFRIENKSRQIAWSFLSAMEAVAVAFLEKRDTIFSSINLEEAKEKIRYAKAVYENLEISGLPKLIIDNQLGLEFDNGVRLTSFPSKAIRGRAKSTVVLDEFAHVQHDKQIYQGSFAVIVKGGYLRIGSSPMGASGTFYEIDSESFKEYSGYERKKTPWWEVRAFCRNVKEAFHLAPALDTAERVELFGNDRIKAIFANVPVEDFQQEFECVYVDESTAWITWNEIKANQIPELKCVIAESRNSEIDNAIDAIDDLLISINRGEIEGQMSAGIDIGRTRNATEIHVVGQSRTDSFPLRLMITLSNCDFDSQKAVMSKMFKTLPVTKGFIDQNGLGRNLAEDMEKKFPAKAEGVNFTNESKKLWATDMKMHFQKQRVPIPVHKDLSYQIHSIKKIISPSKNLIFDTVRNEKHHADKFWALALAIAAANNPILEDIPPIRSVSYSRGI